MFKQMLLLAVGFAILLSALMVSAKPMGRYLGSHQTKPPIVLNGKWMGASVPKLSGCQRKMRFNVLVDGQFSSSTIATAGWRQVSRLGDIVTLEGCPDCYQHLMTLPGIQYVKKPGYVFGLMDAARDLTGVNFVHGVLPSSGLPRYLTGKGVLIGFVDIEFDTHHPAFLDSMGKTRFVALWDQSDSTGARLSPYGYGTMKSGSSLQADSMLGLAPDVVHGTAIASIAGGGDRRSLYYGMAPDAMLAGVKMGYYDNELIDGLQWLFALADSLRVPCVINLSLGGQEGPHDGTTLIDRAIDSLSSAGRIVVGAAGNDGDKGAHLSLNLSSTPQGTWVLPKPGSGGGRSISVIDIWGETGSSMTVTLSILDSVSMNYMAINASLPLRTSMTFSLPSDTFLFAGDTVILDAYVERSNVLNQKPHIEALISSKNPSLYLGASITGRGMVNIWNAVLINSQTRHLAGFGMPGYFDGDNNMTVNEIGGVAKRIITVGSFNSKVSVVNWRTGIYSNVDDTSVLYRLSHFSSFGPTADGRVKPDLTAPGKEVTAAMSRYGSDTANVQAWPNYPDPHGRYIVGQGTSEASPLVAGTVALLLQVSPTLSPESAKTILQQTAIRDEFTGIVSWPTNSWGAGKLNTLGAVSRILDVSVAVAGDESVTFRNTQRLTLSRGQLRFGKECDRMPTGVLQIIDLFGRVFVVTRITTDMRVVNLPHGLSTKTIIVKFNSDTGIKTVQQFVSVW